MKKSDSLMVWHMNELMRMLGNQEIGFYWDNDVKEVIKSFLDFYKPPRDFFYRMSIQHAEPILFAMYQLGKIHGIRQERKRRKENKL